MSSRSGNGPWARLLATAVVRDEGSAVAERGRALVREGEVGPVEVTQGTLSANVAGCSVAITAKPVPPRIWAAMVRFARGNRPLEEAVQGRAQSVHLEHLMIEDWSEPLVPRPYELGRTCSCARDGEPCEHVAALAFAVEDEIDADPSLLLRWRGCLAVPEVPAAATIESTPEPTVDLTDDDPWRAGDLPEPRPLRPLPVGAVLKRLGPSGLQLRGEDLADVLQRAYASFAESA
jgi:SWIM zinc finger